MNIRFIGGEVGFVLIFLTKVSTNLHDVPLELTTALMYPVITHSVYGYDRLEDARAEPESEIAALLEPVRDDVEQTVNMAIVASTAYLAYEGAYPLVPLYLWSVFGYRGLKKEFPLLKPAAVAGCFGVMAYAIPGFVHHHNWDFLHDDPKPFITVAASMWSSSNRLDIRDTEEDRRDGVRTLPVVVGKRAASLASAVSSGISLAAHATHPNFGSGLDYLFELQNIGSVFGGSQEFRQWKRDDDGDDGNDRNGHNNDNDTKMALWTPAEMPRSAPPSVRAGFFVNPMPMPMMAPKIAI